MKKILKMTFSSVFQLSEEEMNLSNYGREEEKRGSVRGRVREERNDRNMSKQIHNNG